LAIVVSDLRPLLNRMGRHRNAHAVEIIEAAQFVLIRGAAAYIEVAAAHTCYACGAFLR